MIVLISIVVVILGIVVIVVVNKNITPIKTAINKILNIIFIQSSIT